MTPVVEEIYYAVSMVDTTLIARTHGMVQWDCWFDSVMDRPRIEAAPCESSRNS
jgi:hypothetical protein